MLLSLFYSSVSSGINAMTAVTLVDIIRPLRIWRHNRDMAQLETKHYGDEKKEAKDSTTPDERYDTILNQSFKYV